MKKILITGNPSTGLAKGLASIFPNADFVSRDNGCDLETRMNMEAVAKKAIEHDVFINNSALWHFRQTLLLELVWKLAETAGKQLHIVCIGSTTDRATKGSSWIYQQEKKALRSYCNQLSLQSVWSDKPVPHVNLISFGTLENNEDKHPGRKCMSIHDASSYVKWIVEAPSNVNINEISLDRIQR